MTMRDISEEFVDAGMKKIRWSIGKFLEKGRMSPSEAEKTLKRIRPLVAVKEAVEEADFIIEAIPEKLELKQKVFRRK